MRTLCRNKRTDRKDNTKNHNKIKDKINKRKLFALCVLYLVIMLVMVSREMMTGAGIFVTFPVDTVENGRLVTVILLSGKSAGISFILKEFQRSGRLYLIAKCKGMISFDICKKISLLYVLSAITDSNPFQI